MLCIGSVLLSGCNNLSADNANKNILQDSKKSTLISALNSYYGEWEVVEDFGYHGIHRTTEVEVFEIGDVIIFKEEVFQYNDSVNIPFPGIEIEITSSANMQQIDRMEYPHEMGFDDQYAQYAKIKVFDNNFNIVSVFYILDSDELVIEGDVHRYYRAVRK